MRTLLAITVLLALSACADNQTDPATAPSTPPSTSPTATPPDPTPTPAPTPAPPVLADPEPDVISTEFPEDVQLPEHGGRYFAVGLSADGPAAVDESVRAVARYGYGAGIGDVGCLQGAGEAYGIPNGTTLSYLLFADKRAAYRFTDAYAAAEDGTQMGVAQVTTYCLD